MDEKPTNKKLRIQGMIDWIVGYMLSNGYPPVLAEISMGLHKSDSTVRAWLAEAKALKLISWSMRTRSYLIPGVYYVDMREEIEGAGFQPYIFVNTKTNSSHLVTSLEIEKRLKNDF